MATPIDLAGPAALTKASVDSSENKAVNDHGSNVTNSFRPNRILLIRRFSLWSKKIVVTDVTPAITLPTNTALHVDKAFCTAVRSAGNAPTAPVAYTAQKEHFYSSTFTVGKGGTATAEDGDTSELLATWKHPRSSAGTAHFTFFPFASEHCSHAITIAPAKWNTRANEFVKDSVLYRWSYDGRLSTRITLTKCLAGGRTVVARFASRFWDWGMGGTLMIAADEIDEAVAVLTALSMVRRIDQRRSES